MKRIVIFASGVGSNAEAIVKYFANNEQVKVVAVLSDKQNAGVHERMSSFGIKTITYTKRQWNEATGIISFLKQEQVDLIVLAGFLAIVQPAIIEAYKNRIINIHPSLLPRHGGTGMWGINVHNAVISSGDKKSGITIHYVTNEIDGGDIIAQFECAVFPADTPEMLAERVHGLEYEHYPAVINDVLSNI